MKISKRLLVFIINVFVVFSLVGCKTIPFDKFVLGESVEKDIEIPYIDIDKTNITMDDIDKIQNITGQIFDTIGEKDYYYNNYNNIENYLNPIKECLSLEFYNKLIANEVKNDFKKMIDNIYYKDNMTYYYSKAIEVGVGVDNELYGTIEVVSIGDTKEFMASTIKLYFNKNFQVIKTEIVSENDMVTNTTNPLTADSLIPNDLSEAKKALNNFLISMKSEELYKSIVNNENTANLQLDTLVNNIDIENKSVEDLKELFKSGRGTFENYHITAYIVNDRDFMANSEFVLTFVDKETTKDFSFIYSRITNKIINVKIKYVDIPVSS